MAIVLLVTTPALATPFTWLVEGTITNLQNVGIGGPYDGAFRLGQSYAWWITMDSAAPDLDSRPGCGQYAPITQMRFASGALALSVESVPGQDYSLNAGASFCTPPVVNSARIRADFGTGLFLNMSYSSLFSSDALPVEPNLVGPGSLAFILFSPSPNPGVPIANATVTSITAVPEPAGTLLLMSGIAGAVTSRWRRRGRAAGR